MRIEQNCVCFLVFIQILIVLLVIQFARLQLGRSTTNHTEVDTVDLKTNHSIESTTNRTAGRIPTELRANKSFFPVTHQLAPRSLCLDGLLMGTMNGAGMGNVIFEILSFIALAKETNRKPMITDHQTLIRSGEILPLFPHLKMYLDEHRNTTNCGNITNTISSHPKCCTYDYNIVKSVLNSSDETIRVRSTYTQGFRYLQNLSGYEIDNFLVGRKDVSDYAETKLFPYVEQRKTKKNVCVHIRRGDFVNNIVSLPSDSSFTITALRLILRGQYRNADIYVMSNDQNWSLEQLTNFTNIFFANSTKSTPPNAEWEFSRRYCDRVLLTASVSTYGWWMAYLSRGQEVYYNSEFSTPGGIKHELNPEHFWPPSWTSIHLGTKLDQ